MKVDVDVQEQLLYFAAALIGFLLMNIGPGIVGAFLPTDRGFGLIMVVLFTYAGAALFLFFAYMVVREAVDRVQILHRERSK